MAAYHICDLVWSYFGRERHSPLAEVATRSRMTTPAAPASRLSEASRLVDANIQRTLQQSQSRANFESFLPRADDLEAPADKSKAKGRVFRHRNDEAVHEPLVASHFSSPAVFVHDPQLYLEKSSKSKSRLLRTDVRTCESAPSSNKSPPAVLLRRGSFASPLVAASLRVFRCCKNSQSCPLRCHHVVSEGQNETGHCPWPQ